MEKVNVMRAARRVEEEIERDAPCHVTLAERAAMPREQP
jgi:hypothetical protein